MTRQKRGEPTKVRKWPALCPQLMDLGMVPAKLSGCDEPSTPETRQPFYAPLRKLPYDGYVDDYDFSKQVWREFAECTGHHPIKAQIAYQAGLLIEFLALPFFLALLVGFHLAFVAALTGVFAFVLGACVRIYVYPKMLLSEWRRFRPAVIERYEHVASSSDPAKS